jgi:hypothetical protein
MTQAIRNFHLPLPDPLYRALRQEAAAVRQPATTVARRAIEAWLRQQKRRALHEAIARYAAAAAGTRDDYDADIEAAGLDVWRAEERAPIRRKRRRRRKV